MHPEDSITAKHASHTLQNCDYMICHIYLFIGHRDCRFAAVSSHFTPEFKVCMDEFCL